MQGLIISARILVMNRTCLALRTMVFLFTLTQVTACKKTAAVQNNTTLAPAIVTGLKSTLPSLLKESSGLCYTDGNLWSFGDSGNLNAIFKIDTATGAIVQIVILANQPNVDYEDITADSLYIYVGDTGNNYGDRKDLRVLRIKKSDINSKDFQQNIHADAINFSYADQTDFTSNNNTNFDCEAITSIGKYLYLFSKNRGDLQTRCYKMPKDTGTYSLTPIATFNSNGKITDATYNPTTKELALLGYMNQKKASFIWFFNDYNGDDFFSGTAKRYTIGDVNKDWQTEGLAYITGKRLMLSCETSTSHPASLYFVEKQ